jgi:hypothetical protein
MSKSVLSPKCLQEATFCSPKKWHPYYRSLFQFAAFQCLAIKWFIFEQFLTLIVWEILLRKREMKGETDLSRGKNKKELEREEKQVIKVKTTFYFSSILIRKVSFLIDFQ